MGLPWAKGTFDVEAAVVRGPLAVGARCCNDDTEVIFGSTGSVIVSIDELSVPGGSGRLCESCWRADVEVWPESLVAGNCGVTPVSPM